MSLIPVILPTTVAAPTFASILTSQDTYLNSLTPLSVVGSGGGGGENPTFSTINVSSMNSGSITTDAMRVSTLTSIDGVIHITSASLSVTGGSIGCQNSVIASSAVVSQIYTDFIVPSTLSAGAGKIEISGLNGTIRSALSTLNISSATVNISNNLTVSSINSIPIFTLSQYEALSTLAA